MTGTENSKKLELVMKDCKLTVEESGVSSVPHHRRLSSNTAKLEAGLKTDKTLTS
jgi:hypothetical protein